MKTHLAFVVDTAAFFISHRLPIAIAALERGYIVDLYTGVAASPAREQTAVAELSKYPIIHWRIKFTSATGKPLSEGAAIWQLARRLNRRRPHVLHGETPDGVLYGGIASRLARVPAFVAGIAGSNGGQAGGGQSPGCMPGHPARSMRMRFALGHRNKHIIVQTADDCHFFVRSRLALPDQLSVIPDHDSAGNLDSGWPDGRASVAVRTVDLYALLVARAAAS